ncbi:MAG: ribbon-helix-helix domain-containing protein [bacterium]
MKVTVSLNGPLGEYVKSKVASGEYKSPEEVVIDALLRLKAEETMRKIREETREREAIKRRERRLKVQAEIIAELERSEFTERDLDLLRGEVASVR